MSEQNELEQLFAATIQRFVAPATRILSFSELALGQHEAGWSGATIRRYEVQHSAGPPVRLITKTMPPLERRVMELLSGQGHANVPFAHTFDLQSDAPVITCLQDLGQQKLGLPGGTTVLHSSVETDRKVASALATIHIRNRGGVDQLSWLPGFDPAYVSQVFIPDFLVAYWQRKLEADTAFAHEFARYTAPLEQAARCFAATIEALWQEGSSLTLTHGELHREHIMRHEGRPYFIDWATARYGPLYLDLVLYFAPHNAQLYREALCEQGFCIGAAEFMDTFNEVRRYAGIKWLCSGIWQWGRGPTAERGRRLLLMLKWAIDGDVAEPAFLLADTAWARLLTAHDRPGGPAQAS